MKYKIKTAALIVFAALSHVAPMAALTPLFIFPLTETNALLTALLVGLAVWNLTYLHFKLA